MISIEKRTILSGIGVLVYGGINQGEVEMAGEDKLIKAVMSPEVSFTAALSRMQNEVYQCVVDLDRIEKWGKEEKKGARRFLQNINKVIHNLERLFGELQTEMKTGNPGKDSGSKN